MLGLIFLLLAAVLAVYGYSTMGFCGPLWKDLILPMGLAAVGVTLLLL